MEDFAADELQKLIDISDEDASSIKELEQKLKTVDRALRWLGKRGHGPGELPSSLSEAA